LFALILARHVIVLQLLHDNNLEAGGFRSAVSRNCDADLAGKSAAAAHTMRLGNGSIPDVSAVINLVPFGGAMTINFETLQASIVLYGLNAIYAALLLIVGWYLSGAAQRVISRVLTVTHRVDPLVTAFLASLARYGVLAVVGIAVLQLLGIQTTSLVAVLGATSLAIGLALQGTLSNLAAGVMLLLFRPFRIGDDVEVAGRAGKVKSLSLFMTELVTLDNTQVLLPNGTVWGAAIINRSAYPGTGEVKISFPVRAGAAAQAAAEEIVKELRVDPRIDRSSEPSVHVSRVQACDLAGAVVELTVTARVRPSDADAVKQTLLDRINQLIAGAPQQLERRPAE
jgi:small conductance mechanosensitive channel